MNRKSLVATTAVALALPLLTAAPSHAEVVAVPDGDDSTMAADIHRVRVAHRQKSVRVRVTFDDLRAAIEPGQGLSLWLDTDPADKGPEYRLVSGLNRGTDYSFFKVNRWAGTGRTMVCNYNLKINWKKDFVVFAAARKCLGKPKTVAVAVKASEQATGGDPQVDWMAGVRTFSPAAARG